MTNGDRFTDTTKHLMEHQLKLERLENKYETLHKEIKKVEMISNFIQGLKAFSKLLGIITGILVSVGVIYNYIEYKMEEYYQNAQSRVESLRDEIRHTNGKSYYDNDPVGE